VTGIDHDTAAGEDGWIEAWEMFAQTLVNVINFGLRRAGTARGEGDGAKENDPMTGSHETPSDGWAGESDGA
jgi:hypothetical protein